MMEIRGLWFGCFCGRQFIKLSSPLIFFNRPSFDQGFQSEYQYNYFRQDFFKMIALTVNNVFRSTLFLIIVLLLTSNMANAFESVPEDHKKIDPVVYGFTLTHAIPHTFTIGETYCFHGTITDPSILEEKDSRGNYLNFVYISLNLKNSSFYESCFSTIERGQEYFSAKCYFSRAGEYTLTINVGNFGYSYSESLKIVEQNKDQNVLKGLNKVKKLDEIEFVVRENELYVEWSSSHQESYALKKLMFTQVEIINSNFYQHVQSYTLSNFLHSYQISFLDFKEFSPKFPIKVSISQAASSDGTLKGQSSLFSDEKSIIFNPCEHEYSDTKESFEFPWQMEANKEIKISLTFKKQILSELLITEPDLNIRKIYLNPKRTDLHLIPPGTTIQVTLIFPKPGANIIEINGADGQAIINRPVYIGNIYPILPGFEDYRDNAYRNDLNPTSQLEEYLSKSIGSEVIEPAAESSLGKKREFLLFLTNNLREQKKLRPVFLNDLLSELAQAHSEDMTENNYFGHYDLQGGTAQQRVIARGIPYKVSENLVNVFSIVAGHLFLKRSGAHLFNTINPEWTHVGIGISSKKDGSLNIAVLFMLAPSSSSIVKYKSPTPPSDQFFQFSSESSFTSTASFSSFKSSPPTDSQSSSFTQASFTSSSSSFSSLSFGGNSEKTSLIREEILKIVEEQNPTVGVREDDMLGLYLAEWMQSNRFLQLRGFLLSKGYPNWGFTMNFDFQLSQGWERKLRVQHNFGTTMLQGEIGIAILPLTNSYYEVFIMFT